MFFYVSVSLCVGVYLCQYICECVCVLCVVKIHLCARVFLCLAVMCVCVSAFVFIVCYPMVPCACVH